MTRPETNETGSWNPGADDEDAPGLPAFLMDPVGALRRRWLWILLATVAGLGATAFLVVHKVPSYQAVGSVLITSQQIPEEFVTSTVQQETLANLNAMVGEVLSQRQLSKLIEKHDLYSEMRADMPMIEVVEHMRAMIDISPQEGMRQRGRQADAGIFGISFEYTDPDVAANVANELASLFATSSIERRSRQARLATDFLRKELEQAEAELRTHNASITDFQTAHRGELPGDLEANLRKLERLQQQIVTLPVLINEKEARLALLQSEANKSTTHTDMLQVLRAQLAEQLGSNTEEHPNIIALRRRIQEMEASESSVSKTLHAGAKGATVEIAQLKAEIAKLRDNFESTEASIAEIDARVARTPGRAEGLSALQQKAEVLRENYLEFLRKVQEAELAETLESAQQGGRISVLDRAAPPMTPTQSRLKVALGGVLASLFFGLAIGALLEMADPVLVGRLQLEQKCGVPLIGALPRLS